MREIIYTEIKKALSQPSAGEGYDPAGPVRRQKEMHLYMNILVCVKQVPDTTEIKIDPEKNTLIRTGVPSIVNPYDAYALEAAACIKDKDPDARIIVASMGPPQAEAALRQCLAVSADKAYLVSGRGFGGSDTLATSYILSQVVRKLEELEGKPFDAIFCGKQAIDGDTAQVGPELAEHLNLPQVTYALEAEDAGEILRFRREIDEGYAIVEVKKPCLATFTKPVREPRYPTIKGKIAAARAEIPVISEDDLPGLDRTRIGLKGSPTRVKKTFVQTAKKNCFMISEANGVQSVAKLIGLLKDDKVI